jgi:diguanylate cyclase (GGDEF)-like protein
MNTAGSPKLIQLLVIPVLFYAGAKLSLALALMPGLVLLWMPNGVLLAALLHFGWRRYGYFALAVAVAEVAADYPTYTLAESVLFACINLGEATIAMLLLRRLNFDPAFARPADLGKFVFAGPIVAAFAAACAASAMYRNFGEAQLSYLQYLRMWWFSDGLGLLIVTPFLLSLWPIGARQRVERVAFHHVDWVMAALGAVAMGLFLAADKAMLFGWPIRPVLLLPFVVYAAARLTPQATALMVVAVAAAVIFVTKDGHQPYGELPLEQTILQVQQFILIVTVMSMGLSALLAQLRGYARQLERRVEKRTAELREANERLQQLAVTDSLTGVPNRRALFAALRREIERYRRHPREIAVIMFDIDHFKAVNDRYGHTVGDLMLTHVADTVAKVVRGADMLARYGGEEFVIVAPETDNQQALQLAERIRAALSESKVDTANGSVSVTASFGVAMLGVADVEPESVLSRADAALYAAKAAGRNQIVFADATLSKA